MRNHPFVCVEESEECWYTELRDKNYTMTQVLKMTKQLASLAGKKRRDVIVHINDDGRMALLLPK